MFMAFMYFYSILSANDLHIHLRFEGFTQNTPNKILQGDMALKKEMEKISEKLTCNSTVTPLIA
jgi:hypothetical protein